MFKKLGKIQPLVLLLFVIAIVLRLVSFDWGINKVSHLYEAGYNKEVSSEKRWIISSDVGDEHTYNGYMSNVYLLENKLKEYKAGKLTTSGMMSEFVNTLSLEPPFSSIPVAPFVFSMFAFLCSIIAVKLGYIAINPFDFHLVYMLAGRALAIFLSCLIVFPLSKLTDQIFGKNEAYQNKWIKFVILLTIVSVPVFLVHSKWLSYNGPLAALEVYILYRIVKFFQTPILELTRKHKIFLGVIMGLALGIKFTVLAAFIVLAIGSLLKYFEAPQGSLTRYFKSKEFKNIFTVFVSAFIIYILILAPAILSGDLLGGISSQQRMLSGSGGTEISKVTVITSFFSQTLPTIMGYLNYALFIIALGYVLINFKKISLPIKLLTVWVSVILLVLFSNKLALNPTRLLTLGIFSITLVWVFIMNMINKNEKVKWAILPIVVISILSTVFITLNIAIGTKSYNKEITSWVTENISEGEAVVLKSTFPNDQFVPTFIFETNKYINTDSVKSYNYKFLIDWGKTSFKEYKKGKVAVDDRLSLKKYDELGQYFVVINPELEIKELKNKKPLKTFKPAYYNSDNLIGTLKVASLNAKFSELYHYNKSFNVYRVEE